MKKRRKSFFLLVAFILGLWLLVSYSSTPERSRKPSDDWARGIPVGFDASGRVEMVVEEDGNKVHMVWPFESEDGIVGIRYLQMGESAQVSLDREVIKIQGEMHSPRLFLTDEGLLHLFWANRVDSTQKWQLWYLQIDNEGNLQSEPMQISDADSGIVKYAAAKKNDGEVWVAWEDVRSGEIMLTGVSAFGEKQAQNTSVAAEGSNPDIVIDEQGQIHLTWINNESDLFYAQGDSGLASSFSEENIFHIPLGTGASLDGPVVGVSGDFVYIFWSILSQSGLEAGTARAEYISFPIGKPEEASGLVRIGILPFEEPPYQPKEGDYSYSELVPASFAGNTGKFIYGPSVIQNPRGELALALAAQQQHRLDGFIQIAVAIMDEGKYKGFTFATRTQSISSDPVLAADGVGNFHLLWREGFSKKDVYYTTTDAETRAEVDHLTLRDASTLILAGGIEGFAAILLFPLAFPWIFPGLVLVVIWRLVRNDEDLTHRASQVILVVSLLLYQISKVLVFPTVVDYVPFSAWTDIAGGWELPLRILVPLIVFGISIAIAERSRRRSKDLPSTLRYYFVVVFLDMTMTLGIYGVNFLGAY